MRNILKKLVTTGTLMAMTLSTSVSADQCYQACGGCGYQECRRAPCITPCVALGAIALAAIIAVAIQNSSCDHAHN